MALLMIFGVVYFFSACAYAALRGGTPERAAAAIMFICTILSPIAAGSFSPSWHSQAPARLAVELIALIGLGAIALTSDRFWPMWAASFQIIPALLSVLKFAGAAMTPTTLSQLTVPWYYPIMGLVVMGTYHHHRRSSNSSPALQATARTASADT